MEPQGEPGLEKIDIDTPEEKPGPGRTNDPEGKKRNIIEVATKEFAENGLSGARIDEIAAKTNASKRMIYYYYGDKEGLYLKVLEEAYKRMRATEAALDLEELSPIEAMEKLVRFTFDHHNSHGDFIRLVMIENIHDARHLKAIDSLRGTSGAAIDQLGRICEAGIESGVFRRDVSPLQLHWHISALSFFNMSNRATFEEIFGHELFTEAAQQDLREQAVEAVLALVRA